MKLKCYITVFYFFFLTTYAQVGIGTTSPNAQLDIRSSNQTTPANNDGILIPKIDAFPATNPTASQQGMLVYLTTTVGANTPGFYYWDNTTTAWIGLQSNNNVSWNLLGNTGTNVATHFFGTTDNKDIIFKRNNIRAGFIGNPNLASGNKNTSFGANSLNAATTGIRNVAFGSNTLPVNTTGTLNVAIGEETLYLNTSGTENVAVGAGTLYSNTTGSYNTAVGRNTMTTNSTGFSNTTLGYFTLQGNTTGNFNTAVGREAMSTNASGVENCAFGVNSLFSNTIGNGNVGYGLQSLRNNINGNYNTAIGRQSLFTNSSGSNNVASGHQSLYSNSTGSFNVALGYQAGYNETGSNKLYIENSSANSSNALIYGEFDTNIVRVNGQLQIGNPAAAPGYSLPTTRGNNGQVLETDGNGNTSWANSNSTFSAMRTNLSSNQSLGTGGWQIITFNTVLFDFNTEFDIGTNHFVASKAGYYEINAGYHTNDQNNTQYYSIGAFVNGSLYQQTTGNHSNLGPVCRTINCMVYLNIGDYVEIYAENYQSGVTLDSFSGKTYFEIRQIK